MKKLLILLFITFPAMATTVKTKKETTIYLDSSQKSEVVSTITTGTVLTVSERKGMFWKTDKGYVSVLDVTRQEENNNGLAEKLRDEALKARGKEENSNRARSMVMGVRGLSETDELSQISNGKPDLKAVSTMEFRELVPERVHRLERLVQEEIENTMKARE